MTRSLDEIRAQSADVRRRANLFVAQHVAYTALAPALVGISLVVVLAFLLPPMPFAAATWVLLGGAFVLGVRAARSSKRGWISAKRAAIAIDRRAGLDERLSTLAAFAGDRQASRLWLHLLNENVLLLPRWVPQVVVPRAMPRSFWPFAVSLALAIALLGSTVVAPSRVAKSKTADDSPSEPPPGDETDAGGRPQTPSDAGSAVLALPKLLAELPERLREAILHPRDGQAGPGASFLPLAKMNAPRGQGGAGGAQTPSDATGGHASEAERGKQGAGAKGGRSNDGVTRGEGAELEGGTGARRLPNEAAAGEPETARGEGPKTLPRVESGRMRAGEHRPKPSGGRGGHGGGEGAGAGGDAQGLFGDKAGAEGRAGGFFPLDLEAQKADRPGDDDEDLGPARRAANVAAEQRLDDAVRRAQVPPEYQPIIQRMFSRPEEAADR